MQYPITSYFNFNKLIKCVHFCQIRLEWIPPQKKKRKRLINNSPEQYELYLQQMESDYTFRSGTLDPTMNDNYLQNEWSKLTDKLNQIGKGPKFSVEEWKKVQIFLIIC